MKEYKFKHKDSEHLVKIETENSVIATQVFQKAFKNHKEWELIKQE